MIIATTNGKQTSINDFIWYVTKYRLGQILICYVIEIMIFITYLY